MSNGVNYTDVKGTGINLLPFGASSVPKHRSPRVPIALDFDLGRQHVQRTAARRARRRCLG